MRITFIRPHLSDRRSADAMEPLVFAILSGLTPKDIDVDLLDERLGPIPADHPTDLVAITVETFTAKRAYQIASMFRRRRVPVVMGGYHVTFQPEEALAYADAVVLGDAEGLWEGLVEDARRGRLQRVYQQQDQPPLAGVRYDRCIFKGKRYTPIAPVQFGRGCRFACDFCSIHAFYGHRIRFRPVAEIVDEIRALGRRSILIVDDNLFADPAKAEELFIALKPLKIRWGCQVSIDVAWRPGMLDLMSASGCFVALIGFESLDSANLSQMRKAWNLRDGDYAQAIAGFYQRGIMVYGSFVFGYDHDTPETFERAAGFAINARLALANFNTLTPTPGSPLYQRLKTQGRLRYERWWLDSRFRYGDAVFEPQQMSCDELARGCNRARQLFYSYSSIFRRAMHRRVNTRGPARLGLYMGANWVARKALSRKVGRQLGSREPLDPVPPRPLPGRAKPGVGSAAVALKVLS